MHAALLRKAARQQEIGKKGIKRTELAVEAMMITGGTTCFMLPLRTVSVERDKNTPP